MDDLRRLEGKSLARAKLRARRRRVKAIRVRAAVGSVVLFALAWAVIFGQLATGNDPVLSRFGKPVASIQRKSAAVAVSPPRQPEEDDEPVAPVVRAEPEPEVEFAPEPEPPPVVTSAS